MLNIIRPGTNIDFASKRHIFLSLSVVVLIATCVLFFVRGLNYGIDFSGGAEIHLSVPKAWDIGKLRKELTAGGVEGLKVQQIGEPSANEYLVRAHGDEKSLGTVSGKVNETLQKTFSPTDFEIKRADVVGPAAGALLRKQGFLAMFYALLVILIYVAIRFDSRYAPGAIVALLHDSLIVLGVFMITQYQFDLTILAAILALIGYSNNDTIIVYDRVRETIHMHPEYSIEKAVNKAVNETLGRTIVTSLTTFMVVSSLWFFGGQVIKNFAFALMIGVIVGTYSSVFIASSVIIFITNYQKKRQAFENKKGKKRKQYNVRPEPKLH